ncbi:MAG TPA: hypothetical protein VJ600_06595 [Holophagaceae bacterium]|nr:hypothetical protein [Holophagaceae bacterium]
MLRRPLLTLFTLFSLAQIGIGQTPQNAAPVLLGSVEVHLDQKWFIYPLDWYGIELIAPSGLTPPVRFKQVDKQGSARIGLLSPGRHLLNIKQWEQGRLSQWAEMSFPIEIAEGKNLLLNIPSDLKIDLIPCPYDHYNGPPRSVESRKAMDAYWQFFPNGYPTFTVSYDYPPSRRLMALPRRLDYPKNELTIRVFPDVPYDDAEDPISLGLLINDTDKDLEFGHPRLFLEARDKDGEWKPIEGPDYLVIDTNSPPCLIPAHSCRNFPVRHYEGPFKTVLRIVMKEYGEENALLTSEPFAGSIHPSQIMDAKRQRYERWRGMGGK